MQSGTQSDAQSDTDSDAPPTAKNISADSARSAAAPAEGGAAPTWADTIPFVPPIGAGLVIKVYDGDTITIAARLPYPGSPLYRFPVRLSGIDSPELRGKSPAEKAAAVVARDALSAQVLGRVVELRNTGCEKYGRLLADVYLGASPAAAESGPQTPLHINLWMLENGYAVPYDGGKKGDFIPAK
jgi:endonuclease YncB( thermonuclease family)